MTRSLLHRAVWSHFEGPDGRFQGLLFESLSKALLLRLYGGKWRQTPRSHDHARDFEFLGSDASFKAWAECKMHKTNLALTTIGSTLVMALVESINKLVLISYSDLSSDCALQVARFSRRSGCSVDVIAGSGLDSLLLEYPEVVASVLPQLDLSSLPLVRPTLAPEIRFEIDYQPDLVVLNSSSPGEQPPAAQASLPILHPGNDVLINVHVHNPMHDRSVHGNIRVQTSRAFAGFHTGAGSDGILELPIVVGPNQFTTSPIRFRIGDSPGATALPHCEVFDHAGQSLGRMQEARVEISAVHWVSNIIGRAAEELKQAVEACREPSKIACMVVDGHSGVGKSRFLAELAGKLWAEGYDLLRIDMEELGGGSNNDTLLLRHILAQLHALPLLEPRADEASDLRKQTLAEDDTHWVEQLLYGGTALRAPEDISRCAVVLAKGLAEKRTAFLIDNAQNVSKLEQQVFEQVGRLVLGKGEAAIALSFNVDKIYGRSPGGALYEYCLEQCLVAPGHWARHTLVDFRREDVRTFLNAALLPRDTRQTQFSEAFPLTCEAIEQSSAPRPLYLWHMLLALQAEDILRREGAAFVPRRAGEFTESVKKLPARIHNLLEQRWRNTLAASPPDSQLEALRSLVGLFFSVPAWLAGDLRIATGDVVLLEKAGFIRRTSTGDLLPSHQEVYRLFEEEPLGHGEARRIAQALRARNQHTRYLYQYFICKDALNEVDASLLGASLAHLESRRVEPTTARGGHFLSRMIAILDAGSIAGVPHMDRLRLLRKAIANLSQIASNKLLVEPLKVCFDHAHAHIATYRDCGEDFFAFIHQISNLCFARNAYALPYALMKEVAAGPDRFSFSSEIERALCQGALLNRLGVAAMWQARAAESHKFGLDSRNIAKALAARTDLSPAEKERAVALCIETAIDLGNIHDILLDCRDDAAMLAYWGEAVELVKDLPEESQLRRDLTPMVTFYGARVLMDGGHWSQARTILQDAIWLARQNRDSYHGVRCILLLVILELLALGPSADLPLPGIRRQLDRALDWAVASGTSHAEWGGLLLRAEVAAAAGNYADAADIAADSLQAFQDTGPNAAMVRLRTPYLASAVAILRMAEIAPAESPPDRHGPKNRGKGIGFAAEASEGPWQDFDACDSLAAVARQLEEKAERVPYLWRGYPLLSQ